MVKKAAKAVPDLAHLPAVADLLPCASVSLLIGRTQAVKPGFALTETNAREIAEICVRLEGLPLALELAAARLHVLSPKALLARLSAPLQILTHGPVDLPERQQTLRRTIRWSYDLLKQGEQLIFPLPLGLRQRLLLGGNRGRQRLGRLCRRTGARRNHVPA